MLRVVLLSFHDTHCFSGVPGPRLESFVFAVDADGLQVLLDAGVFHIRTCKLCTDTSGIVVGSEYAITTSLFERGYNVRTLLSKYSPMVRDGMMMCRVMTCTRKNVGLANTTTTTTHS